MGKRATDDDRYVSARVRETRVLRKMSMEDVAAELGVTWQQVAKYETGANRISAGRLVRIASILKVPVADLMPKVIDSEDGKVVPLDNPCLELGKTRRGLRIARAFMAIEEADFEKAEALVVMAETFAGNRKLQQVA